MKIPRSNVRGSSRNGWNRAEFFLWWLPLFDHALPIKTPLEGILLRAAASLMAYTRASAVVMVVVNKVVDLIGFASPMGQLLSFDFFWQPAHRHSIRSRDCPQRDKRQYFSLVPTAQPSVFQPKHETFNYRNHLIIINKISLVGHRRPVA